MYAKIAIVKNAVGSIANATKTASAIIAQKSAKSANVKTEQNAKSVRRIANANAEMGAVSAVMNANAKEERIAVAKIVMNAMSVQILVEMIAAMSAAVKTLQ
jgi:hypothetical protein